MRSSNKITIIDHKNAFRLLDVALVYTSRICTSNTQTDIFILVNYALNCVSIFLLFHLVQYFSIGLSFFLSFFLTIFFFGCVLETFKCFVVTLNEKTASSSCVKPKFIHFFA